MFSSVMKTDFSIQQTEIDCDFWQVSVYDGENLLEFKTSGLNFFMDLPKNVVLGVLAYPVKNGKKMEPLGAVYPFSTDLNKKGSFPAYIADRLYRSAVDSPAVVQDFVSRFNWPKFMELVNEFENPWQLDRDRIVKSIANGSFKKSDLKLTVE